MIFPNIRAIQLMSTKGNIMNLLILVLAVLMLCSGATAQSSCSSTLMSLSSCLNYVSGNTSAPSASCCTSLANVVQSQPLCLCQLLNGAYNSTGSALGLAINQTLALGLPSICNVKTPPVSQCNDVANVPVGAPVPVSSPVNSPTDVPDEQPNNPTTTTVPSSIPSGSKTVPKTSGSISNKRTIKSWIQLPVVALLIAAWSGNALNFF